MNKIIMYVVGLIFILFGLAVTLIIFDIPLSSATMLILGLSCFFAYCKFHFKIFKYLSCCLIPTGFVYFILTNFEVSVVTNFLLLYSSIICALMLLYFTSKRKVFLFIALAVAMYMLHVYTNAHSYLNKYIWGYDCFYLGILMIIAFIFEHNSLRYIPLAISVAAYLIGVLNFLAVFGLIHTLIFKLSIALIFTFVGVFIITYNFIKSKID